MDPPPPGHYFQLLLPRSDILTDKNIMVVIVILILSSVSAATELDTNIEIFTDLVELSNLKFPLVICRNVQDLGLKELTTFSAPASFISYDTNGETDNVLNHVMMLQSISELDGILFTGSGHSTLVQSLVNDLKIFNFGITGVLPESEYLGLNLNLTLNTRLFILEKEENLTTRVKEVYAVKGLHMTGNMGSWNETDGLTISQPNIWERRNNLNGVTIRATSLNYSSGTDQLPYHHLHNDVTGGEGYFIEPLYYLASKLNFTKQFIYCKDGKWGGRE